MHVLPAQPMPRYLTTAVCFTAAPSAAAPRSPVNAARKARRPYYRTSIPVSRRTPYGDVTAGAAVSVGQVSVDGMAASSSTLPVVDLAPFFAGDEAGVARATEAVREACQTYGFFRAVSHGVPAELMTRVLELSAAFFELPDEEKAKVRRAEGSARPTGYGRQPANSGDKSEFVMVSNPKLGVNVYPEHPAGFREAAEDCHAKLTELALLIQDILNDSLGLPPGFLRDYNDDRSFDFMWSKRYVRVSEDETSFCQHEDGNCITFILQDGVGGLEVLKDGHWIPADPVDGSIIVNIGDTLQVLSNNKLKSATHRVVRKSEAKHRHSLVFFFTVHGDKWVEPLPELTTKIGEAPRYRGFAFKEYLQLRIRNRTHPPSRPEDLVTINYYAI